MGVGRHVALTLPSACSFNVFQGQELDGNGTTQMGPAIESPMVLEGNWCASPCSCPHPVWSRSGPLA